ncbi:MAG: crotonase/enoyl-CoA hydratase family protein [Novosphingobium sp.]
MNFHDRVALTLEDGVAHVRLDRPDKLNALDDAMFDGLVAAGAHLLATPRVRCVVLSGAGLAFCAGLDLAMMERIGDADLVARTHGEANRLQQAALVWRELPVPVIAAIHGVCFGGGLQIAGGADVRVCAPDARLAVLEVKWGLVPDMGGFVLWRGNVRDDVLRELTFTAREFSGEEGAALGFATHIDPDPLARATVLARGIASRSPDAVRAAKALANRAHDRTTAEILAAESETQARLIGTPNQREAVAAGLARRPPAFADPEGG